MGHEVTVPMKGLCNDMMHLHKLHNLCDIITHVSFTALPDNSDLFYSIITCVWIREPEIRIFKLQ